MTSSFFSDGTPQSLQGILLVLEEFKHLSGLGISVEKSCLFTAALSPDEVTYLQVSSRRSQGHLPIRYLGLPLCTKKLTFINCEPLWKGSLEGRHVARVAWETITSPKEGGLGLKNLLVWNQTCSLKLLWMLFFRTKSVWVAGNGNSCRFWTHQWSSFGCLIGFVGSQEIPITATLSSLWVDGQWRLPPARNNQFEQVSIYLTSLTLTNEADFPRWEIDGSVRNGLCSADIWMFILNRCRTKDRLASWGIFVDPLCLLCELESRDHLLFACPYSRLIWSSFSHCIGLNRITFNWDIIIEDLLAFSGNKHKRYLTNLVWQACIYEIWRERNERLHRQIHRSAASIISRIELIVKNRISAFRNQNHRVASEIIQLWFSLL